ncbi:MULTISPECIES: aldo/keto reductase [unclassified Mesorhizobium]|uniref:aldo/keto reductase n=1 Tax=unclassified Mesorhizobium TaxID=325217 RepID=UPI000FCAF899|nr:MULTISPECIES: aldo/keto reductase [unclassified Mesorhizobium]RUU63238.1 aldo/keto reductase [Mesorhizobium sp. M7A.T.Ca.TU.009.01.1.1]RUU72324.1 aldo/keto reductase [Mesorhizobium sp. M7A.T.Ca.TU.009.01.1.2]RUT86337.1 aldo/keto reductase [Mesorhizobium sp. M7A.T.Ca.US.000.02.1.1]RUT90660.1 aldo/keto reductase [Mesorhizobium sp. M7A.T.Ca.US.000.02.2.1]RUT99429.1 aldo/keto reductase [Mesorhizobium sp. M7A.T.Ca.TU.009.02.1.1]
MEKRRIGQTALEVTEVSFGGAALGGLYRACSREAAMETLQGAWDAGLRYFDTAPFYGFGLSERRFGDFLRYKPRDSYVLSTKVGRLFRPVPDDQVPDHSYVDPLPFALDYDYSYDGIMRSVEFSYARLGLNRIDILFVHDIGAYTHGVEKTKVHFRDLMDGGLKALEELKRSGVISAYGLGVNEVQICLDVMREAPLDCILLASRYSLLDRSAEAELLPLCRARQTSLVIGGVFNSGILATGPVQGAHFDYRPASHDVLDRVGAMERIAAEGGYPLAAAAFQFPLHEPAVATVLTGTAKLANLTRNLQLLDIDVPETEYARYRPHTLVQEV